MSYTATRRAQNGWRQPAVRLSLIAPAVLAIFGQICGEPHDYSAVGRSQNTLSKLVDEAAAGKIITIAKHGRAMAQLVPVGKSKGRRIGAMQGKLVIPDDFDAPLSDDLIAAFQGTHS